MIHVCFFHRNYIYQIYPTVLSNHTGLNERTFQVSEEKYFCKIFVLKLDINSNLVHVDIIQLHGPLDCFTRTKYMLKTSETWNEIVCLNNSTHCGLATPYGDIDLCQHWFRYRLIIRRHQAITWSNVDLVLRRAPENKNHKDSIQNMK